MCIDYIMIKPDALSNPQSTLLTKGHRSSAHVMSSIKLDLINSHGETQSGTTGSKAIELTVFTKKRENK